MYTLLRWRALRCPLFFLLSLTCALPPYTQLRSAQEAILQWAGLRPVLAGAAERGDAGGPADSDPDAAARHRAATGKIVIASSPLALDPPSLVHSSAPQASYGADTELGDTNLYDF